METKICTRCKTELPATIEHYGVSIKGKLGLKSVCKPCTRDIGNAYYATHTEQRKIYKEANKEKISEKNKQYRLNHVKERNDYLKGNKIKLSEKQQEYYQTHQKHLISAAVKWKQAHPEKARLNEQKRNAVKRNLPHTLTTEEWEVIKKNFSNKCCYCGKDGPLKQDHFVPLSKGGEYTRNNIVPACQSCNSSKGAKDFYEWYPRHRGYSKARESKILQFLNISDVETRQLQLFI